MRKMQTLYGKEARDALKRGVDEIYTAVSTTLGARGRNGVYREFGIPLVTNDGVSIARKIRPENDFEALGSDMVLQGAEQTNDDAGDGTTSTVVVTESLITGGMKYLDKGKNPVMLKKELDEVLGSAVKALEKKSVPVENLVDVARVSVEDDAIAQQVADTINDVGEKGSVLVEESHGLDITVDRVKGYWFDKGYTSPYMVTNERNEADLHDCAVIVTDRSLNLNQDLFQALTGLKEQGFSSVLVIADKVEGELLQTIVENKMRGILTTVCVSRPQNTESLEDIATLVGATAVTADKGINEISKEHAGSASHVVVKNNQTIIVGKESKELTERVASIQQQINTEEDKHGRKEDLKERLARLAGGLAVIKVGAHSDTERQYLKLKIDDAVGACRAAIAEGIVPGGGTTLRDIAASLKETTDGARIFREALRAPYRKILENAGMDNEEIDKNYNVLTGEEVEDMMKEGIVDPAKVVRCTMQNATSVAKTFLTTETAIVPVPEKNDQKGQG